MQYFWKYYRQSTNLYRNRGRERKPETEGKEIERDWRKKATRGTSGDVVTMGESPGHAQTATSCCSDCKEDIIKKNKYITLPFLLF